MVTHVREFREGERKFGLDGRSLNGYEMKRLWRNEGAHVFTDISVASGAADIRDGRGFTACDFDRDGDLDLFLRNYRSPTAYLRNEGVAAGWLAIRLRGTASNRDAVGSKIEIDAGGKRQVRWVTAGSGYLSQMPGEAYFGLGGETRVDRIRVRWPNGTIEDFGGADANRHVRLTEGSAKIEILPEGKQAVLPSVDTAEPSPLVAALATCDLRELDGRAFDLKSLAGPHAVVFWAPWCNTCRNEVAALNTLHAAHAPAGAGVLGICVTGDPGPTVAEVVAELKPAYPVVTIPRADFDRLFGKDAAVPRSFLLDGVRAQSFPDGAIRPQLVRAFMIEAMREK